VPQQATNAEQPISWDNSIIQIGFGCNIHQLFQSVNQYVDRHALAI
jgi:hypothetical protein